MKKWRTRLFAAAAVAAVVAVAFPAAAQASNAGAYGTTFVDGADGLKDDFGDHANEVGDLCSGCGNSQGNDLVALWQVILYSEGLLTMGQVDGYFGPTTKSATQAWQRRFGLDDDGRVGPSTWGAADDRLLWPTSSAVYLWYDAKGTSGHVALTRGDGANGEGAYDLQSATNGSEYIDLWSTSERLHFGKLTNFFYP